MDKVEVAKATLIKRITENRKNHAKIVKEALIGYRKAAIRELDMMLSSARRGGHIRTHVSLEVPQDHTADYDAVIDMLTLEVQDTVTITAQAFRQYVRDEWHWKNDFILANSMYSGTAARVARVRVTGGD